MKRRLRQSGGHGRRGGQVLVETALVFTAILLPLSLAIVQFGMMYSATNTLTQMARDAARFAAVYGLVTTDNPSTPGDESSDSFILQHIQAAAASTTLSYADLTNITITPPRAQRTQYSQITVSMSYNLNKKSILSAYKPGVITRTAVAMLE